MKIYCTYCGSEWSLKEVLQHNTMFLLKWCINSHNCAQVFTIIDQSSSW